MLEWILNHPVLGEVWFLYITFHDPFQWLVMTLVGWTAWGQRKKRKEWEDLVHEMREELSHVHQEIHDHMEEDARLHADLGQYEMRRGEPNGSHNDRA